MSYGRIFVIKSPAYSGGITQDRTNLDELTLEKAVHKALGNKRIDNVRTLTPWKNDERFILCQKNFFDELKHFFGKDILIQPDGTVEIQSSHFQYFYKTFYDELKDIKEGQHIFTILMGDNSWEIQTLTDFAVSRQQHPCITLKLTQVLEYHY